jgi:hypothetical protein
MGLYLNIKTLEYPRYDGDLALLGWSPNQPLPENWVEVVYTEPPTVDSNTSYVQEFPVLIDNIWTVTWKTIPLTESEILRRDTPIPEDGKIYIWNENLIAWEELNVSS